MEISKLQSNGLLIKTKNANLAINPFDAKGKVSSEAAGCDFALSSNPFQEKERIAGEKRIFSWPGEYEVKGVAVHAFPIAEADPAVQPDLLYVVYSDSFKFCYLPKLKKELHSDLIEKIGDIDLLIFPAEGDQKIWQETIEEIEPKAILPLATDDNPTAADQLITKLGLAKSEPAAKLTFKSKSDFSSDKMGLFLLT